MVKPTGLNVNNPLTQPVSANGRRKPVGSLKPCNKEVTMSNELKAFRSSIKQIAALGGKLSELVHNTAIAMAAHAKEHGDMTLFVDLYNALHTANRRKAFTAWLYDFTPIRLKIKDDVALAKGSRVLKPEEKGFTGWNLEGLNAVTYWDYTAERDPKAFDADSLLKAIERLTKRLDNAIEKGNVSPDLDVGAAHAYLTALSEVKAPPTLRVITH